MVWFWYFLIYSFLGFLVEVAYVRLVGGVKRDRKCRLVLPICPVYGLGALAISSCRLWSGTACPFSSPPPPWCARRWSM